jgi:lipopolysaccharide/colanic/teichoic acid biosynthesis glycosyltransferase
MSADREARHESDDAAQRWLRSRRGIDALAAILCGAALLPLSLTICLLVWIIDRSGPLITLPRVGRNFSALSITKIQTMRPRPNSGSSLTAGDDDRVTHLGQRLRRLHLDELPQLVSVISGDMALIGPRPEAPEWVDATNPLWQRVLECRPGIGGLTQVVATPWEAKHLVGVDYQTRYENLALPAKLAIDAWYADHASPRVDAIVVASVFQLMVLKRSKTSAHALVALQIPEASALIEGAM